MRRALLLAQGKEEVEEEEDIMVYRIGMFSFGCRIGQVEFYEQWNLVVELCTEVGVVAPLLSWLREMEKVHGLLGDPT